MSSAKASDCCCPPGSYSFANPPQDYVPQGDIRNVQGLETYFVGSQSSKHAIVIICDVYGLHSGLHKVIADELAKELNILVAIPDLFHGEPPFTDTRPANEGFMKVLQSYLFHHIEPDLTKVLFPYLKDTLKIEKIGMIGFCYGMYLITKLLPTGQIAAAASPHPSIYAFMNNLNEDPASYFKASKCPVMLLNSGSDPADQGPDGALHNAIKESEHGASSVFQTFPDMIHGWSVRGEATDATIRSRKEVMGLFLSFFKNNLL